MAPLGTDERPLALTLASRSASFRSAFAASKTWSSTLGSSLAATLTQLAVNAVEHAQQLGLLLGAKDLLEFYKLALTKLLEFRGSGLHLG